MVYCVKVDKKETQRVKQELIKKKVLDNRYRVISDKNYIYLPLKKKISGYDIINKQLKQYKETPKKLKDELKEILTKDEMNKVKTSYDQVGEIAILEIDDDLRKKEKIIAEILLKTNKNILTVVRKDSEHKGKYRLQKIHHLAGKKQKTTIHKENGVQLKLNIEKVYFSSRMATERIRIASLVKPNEEVLVMFSGCAPYPIVIAKNSKAKAIYGIEMNPEGQKYGLENCKLNKLDNVFLINSDVNPVLDNFYNYILGLKSSTNKKQLNLILKKNPKVIELHLQDNDLLKNTKIINDTIIKLKQLNIPIFIHQPLYYQDGEFHMSIKDFDKVKEHLTILGKICKKNEVNAVVHPSGAEKLFIDKKELINRIKYFKQYFDYFYFETTYKNSLFKDDRILNIAKESGLKNICIDVSHLHLEHKNTDNVVKLIKKIKDKYNTYFHIADYNKGIDAQSLLNENMELEKILPLINYGIVEVRSKDENKKEEMLESFEYLKDYNKKFDRVIMPAPHNAYEFLGKAIVMAKDKGWIHFYTFSNEDEINNVKDFVKHVCKLMNKKCKIKNVQKCGQNSPRSYRICVDFQII